MAAPQTPKGVMLQGMHQLPPQPIFAGVWPPVQEHLGCLMWQQSEAAIEPRAHEIGSPEWWEAHRREREAEVVNVDLEIAKGAEAFREPRDVRPLPHKSTCMALNAEPADCTCGVTEGPAND